MRIVAVALVCLTLAACAAHQVMRPMRPVQPQPGRAPKRQYALHRDFNRHLDRDLAGVLGGVGLIIWLILSIRAWRAAPIMGALLLVPLLCLGGCATGQSATSEFHQTGVTWTLDENGNVKTIAQTTTAADARGGMTPGSSNKEAHGGAAQAGPLGASGGGADSASWAPTTGLAMFYWAAIVVGLAAVPVYVWVSRTLALGLALAAGAFVAVPVLIEKYPWIFLLPIVLLVLCVLYAIYQIARGNWKLDDLWTKMKTVVAGIEKTKESDPQAGEVATTNIGAAAKAAGISTELKATVDTAIAEVAA